MYNKWSHLYHRTPLDHKHAQMKYSFLNNEILHSCTNVHIHVCKIWRWFLKVALGITLFTHLSRRICVFVIYFINNGSFIYICYMQKVYKVYRKNPKFFLTTKGIHRLIIIKKQSGVFKKNIFVSFKFCLRQKTKCFHILSTFFGRLLDLLNIRNFSRYLGFLVRKTFYQKDSHMHTMGKYC